MHAAIADMAWSRTRVDVALWNLSVGVAAAGCHPSPPVPGVADDDDDDNTNLTEATSSYGDDPTSSTSSGDDCDPACALGYSCVDGICVPDDDTDDGCYDYGCDPYECYDSDDCEAGEFCSAYYYCYAADVLPACDAGDPSTRTIPLPAAFVGGAVALAFGDAEAGGGDELLVVQSGEARLITAGGAAITEPAALEGAATEVWVAAAEIAERDGFALSVPREGTRLITLEGDALAIGSPDGTPLEWIASGDFDGDGLGDVVGSENRRLHWLPGTGSGFGAAIDLLHDARGALGIGDFDDDARDDVAYTHSWDYAGYLGDLARAPTVHGLGSYDFADYTVAAGDFDGDALSDVVTVSRRESSLLLVGIRNLPADASFEVHWPMQAPDQNASGDPLLGTGDFDGDGAHDLFVAGDSVVRVVFGDLAVRDRAPFRCWADIPIDHAATSIAVGDLDGDARADVAFSDGAATTVVAHE